MPSACSTNPPSSVDEKRACRRRRRASNADCPTRCGWCSKAPACRTGELLADQPTMLRDGGAILRAAVEGIMMLLLARSAMRKEFGADERTMAAARDNNPLKLHVGSARGDGLPVRPGRAHRRLSRPGAGGGRCVRGSAHARARVDGRHARGGAGRPGALRSGKPSSARSRRARRASAWRAARRSCGSSSWCSRTSSRATRRTDFNKAFGRDFMGAYQEQLRRLKGGR